VKNYLGMGAGDRIFKINDELNAMLSVAIPSLARLSVERRFSLLTKMNYEFHPKETVLTYDGAEASSVYFLMAGQAEVREKGNGKNITKNAIKPGCVIGVVNEERYFKAGRVIRDEKIVCSSDCDFVRVDIDEYNSAQYSDDIDSWDNRMQLIKKSPFFQGLNDSELTTAAKMSTAIHLTPTSSIHQQQGDYKHVYIVSKGKCTIARKLDFTREITIEVSTVGDKSVRFGAWEPLGVTKRSPFKLFQNCKQKIAYAYITTGDAFPGLPMSPLLPLTDCEDYYIPKNLHGMPVNDVEKQTGIVFSTNCMTLTSVEPHGSTILKFPLAEFFPLMIQHGVYRLKHRCKYQVETLILQETYLRSVVPHTIHDISTPNAQFYVMDSMKAVSEDSTIVPYDPFKPPPSKPSLGNTGSQYKSRRGSMVITKKPDGDEIDNIWGSMASRTEEKKGDLKEKRRPSNAAM
jgi:hypothetical protein